MATTPPLKNAVLVSETGAKSIVKNEFRYVINDQVTMATNSSRTYNLDTLLGSDAVNYDFKTTNLDICVIDTETGSPTNGFFVDGSSVIAHGFKVTGEVILKNTFSATLTVLIRVRVNKKLV